MSAVVSVAVTRRGREREALVGEAAARATAYGASVAVGASAFGG
jgi:hypothetical protein